MPVQQALAADPTVTITVSAWTFSSPTGLTLTYISDYEVELTWVKGEGAENTMVRAAIGRPPTSVTDGIEIYYGDGITSTSWINMETLSAPVYYRAWSQNPEGIWSALFTENQIEGVGMILIALIILAMGFTIASYIFKKGMLAFAGAGSWMIASIYCLTKSTITTTGTWDVYFGLAFLFIGLLLACMFSPLAWRETTPADEIPEEPDVAEMRVEMEMFNRERNQFAFLRNNNRRQRRRTRW